MRDLPEEGCRVAAHFAGIAWRRTAPNGAAQGARPDDLHFGVAVSALRRVHAMRGRGRHALSLIAAGSPN
jgi:hypothetical protein